MYLRSVPSAALFCAEEPGCKAASRHEPVLAEAFVFLLIPLQLVFREPETCMRIFLYANSLHFQDRPGNGKKGRGEGRGRGT